ncbi:ribose 5-phosphate isomerase B [Dongia sp.]|uniref:ribose 5-phosphate isomerase B n=1 Tax=Dongia sp. TaxID=1977262 RepID=UPI0035B366D8
MMAEKIAIASDHAGFELKTQLKQELERLGFEPVDLGTDGPASVDYPDFALKMAETLKAGTVSRGVLVCGSGIGISMAANRHPQVRAALCHDHLTAKLARQHNNANVLCLGGRTTGADVARDCLQVFLGTEFEGGRHQNRVAKFS